MNRAVTIPANHKTGGIIRVRHEDPTGHDNAPRHRYEEKPKDF